MAQERPRDFFLRVDSPTPVQRNGPRDWKNSSMYDDEQTQLALSSIVAALSVVVLVVASWYWHSSNEKLKLNSNLRMKSADASLESTAELKQENENDCGDVARVYNNKKTPDPLKPIREPDVGGIWTGFGLG